MEDFKVTANFNLLVKKSTDEFCTVRLIVRWGNKTVKVSTGIKVVKAMWDSKLQRLFTSEEKFTVRANRDARKTNKQLDAITDTISAMIKQSSSNDRIYENTDAMKNEITSRLSALSNKQQIEDDKQNQGATSWMLRYINSDRIDTHTMRYVAERTKIHQRTVVHRLQSFIADCNLSDKFDTFTSKDFERLYTNWAYKKKNYKQNTVIASFGVLKPLLNAAKKDGIEIDDTYYKELQGNGKDVDNIYLTEDEIKKIYNLDIQALKASGDIDSKSNIEATNMYLRGMSTIAIMQLTGHTTEHNFLKYIKVTAEQNAMMVAKMMKQFNF